ncbi:MAG: hypothetical protein LBV54_08645, partial [Puniceicoccales bacterium]|nr:hypothetical protein [Puniceicoccales bacterium]
MKQQSSFLKTVHSFAQKNFSRNIFRTTRSAFAGALFVFFFGCAAHHEQYERPESEAQKQATLANTYY